MFADSSIINSRGRSESLRLPILGLVLLAVGIYYLGINFPYPPDDRGKHLWSLFGGVITGSGLAICAFAGRHRRGDPYVIAWALASAAVVFAAIGAASFTAAFHAGS